MQSVSRTPSQHQDEHPDMRDADITHQVSFPHLKGTYYETLTFSACVGTFGYLGCLQAGSLGLPILENVCFNKPFRCSSSFCHKGSSLELYLPHLTISTHGMRSRGKVRKVLPDWTGGEVRWAVAHQTAPRKNSLRCHEGHWNHCQTSTHSLLSDAR